MKILITGGGGLLGQYLNFFLDKEFEILTIYNQHIGNCKQFNSVKLDLTNYDKIKEIFLIFKPDIVIHTAAISRPEIADILGRAFVSKINVEVTKKMAELCSKHKAKLIFTSTDLVYEECNSGEIAESSALKPLSLYAQTKVDAENEIINTFDNYIILRTALLIGMSLDEKNVNSSFHKMLKALESGQNVYLYSDQNRTPLSLFEATRIMISMIKENIKGEIINFAGKNCATREEIGRITCRAGSYNSDLIIPILLAESDNTDKVFNLPLNTSLLDNFSIKRKDIGESIREIIDNFKNNWVMSR